MAHPPPCNPQEVIWNGECYPRINTFRVIPVDGSFTFEIEGASPETYPMLHGLSGDTPEMSVEKAGPAINVLIKSMGRVDAEQLLKKLDPDNKNPQLPD